MLDSCWFVGLFVWMIECVSLRCVVCSRWVCWFVAWLVCRLVGCVWLVGCLVCLDARVCVRLFDCLFLSRVIYFFVSLLRIGGLVEFVGWCC